MSIEHPNSESVRRIHAFVLGDEERPLAFAQRLMERTGWPSLHTLRVIEEYRRFLVVAALGEHPVSPSKAVDEAWHLHLLFTRNYWLGLCAGVLGRALHHDPDSGRGGQTEQLTLWYGRTLETYTRVYGERPPVDIWPGAEPITIPPAADHRRNISSSPMALGHRAGAATWLLASGLLFGCTPAATMATLSTPGWIVLGVVGTLGLVLVALLVALGRSASRSRRGDGVTAATRSDGGSGGEAFPWWIMSSAGSGSDAVHQPSHHPGSSHHAQPHAGHHDAASSGDSAGGAGDAGSSDGGGGDGGGGGSDGGAGCSGGGCGGS